MSGEQHVPTLMERLRAETVDHVLASMPDTPWADFAEGLITGQAVKSAAIRQILDSAPDAEARALPDRETIARLIATHDRGAGCWEHLDEFEQAHYLAVADAVLALFGQEGQR